MLIYNECDWRGTKAALKMLKLSKKKQIINIEALRDFRQEIIIQGRLNHKNIVKIEAICMEPVSIIAELCTQGNLYDYLHNCVAIYIAEGLKYLQSNSQSRTFRYQNA